MAASVRPLTPIYAITEAFGLERGIDKSFREAPAFLTIYTSLIVLGAAIAMFPGAPLALITNLPNIVNGLLLPLLLPLLLLLANDRRILGRYAHGLLTNVLSDAVFLFLTAGTGVFLGSVFFPRMVPSWLLGTSWSLASCRKISSVSALDHTKPTSW